MAFSCCDCDWLTIGPADSQNRADKSTATARDAATGDSMVSTVRFGVISSLLFGDSIMENTH
jgi:hypothetical protein